MIRSAAAVRILGRRRNAGNVAPGTQCHQAPGGPGAGQVTTLLHPPADVEATQLIQYVLFVQDASYPLCCGSAAFILCRHDPLSCSILTTMQGSAGLSWSGVRSYEDPVQYQDECGDGEQSCYCNNYPQSIPLLFFLHVLQISIIKWHKIYHKVMNHISYGWKF